MNNDLTSKHELTGKISYCLWKYQHEHRDSIKVITDISNEILDIIENAQPVEQPQGEWVMVTVSDEKGGWKRAPVCNRCACKKPDNIGQTFILIAE